MFLIFIVNASKRFSFEVSLDFGNIGQYNINMI